MAKRRLFLTGSNRAEFEHIWGPLTQDSTDPRFVLVDEELEAKIAKLPPGVPVQSGQRPDDIAGIRASELEAFGVGDENQSGGKSAVKAEDLVEETPVEKNVKYEPKGAGESGSGGLGGVAHSGFAADGSGPESADSKASKSK